MDKLRIKFLTLNVDYDGLSLDYLVSRKIAHEGIKERYPRKSRLQIGMDMHALVTSFSVVSRSMTLKNRDLPKIWGFIDFAIFGCSAHSKNELRRSGWRFQTDSLRTGTAIGFRASREH